MTTQEQIEYLATKVMGWEWRLPVWADFGDSVWCNKEGIDVCSGGWNPLTDWNHWRQVEEKVLKDPILLDRYAEQTRESVQSHWMLLFEKGMEADLPTRCQAIISAHQELYPDPA